MNRLKFRSSSFAMTIFNSQRLYMCVCVSAASGHTDCLQMLLSSEEDTDLPNVLDTEGQ